MHRRNPLKQDIINQAKSANLIDYMLANHPDRVINCYGIRDRNHDSLVLYPDSFCRYSTMEVQDSIHYLEHYQGYRWRDAVLGLAEFAGQRHGKPGTPAFCAGCHKANGRFFRPAATGHIDLITDYLHTVRGISLETIQSLVQIEKIYPAAAPGYGEDFACFANEPMQFYSLRNISTEGFPKLQFTKETCGFWWFSPTEFPDGSLFDYLKHKETLYPAELPLYICESPIDAISLYELRKEPAIYSAMGGLKPNTALNIIREFSTARDGDSKNRRRVIIATDNDVPGSQFMEHFPAVCECLRPCRKDWNEDLTSL